MSVQSGLSSGSPPEISTTLVCSAARLGQQPRHGLEIHIRTAVTPIVTGDAT